MNPVSSRLKAVAVTALFFALAAFALLGVLWGLVGLPLGFPGQSALAAYRPHDTVATLSDLRLPVALTAAFVMAFAIVLVFDSAYLDRMIAIFSDVLLMLMGALAGFVAGYWTMLRLAGFENFIRADFLQAAAIPPLVVFAVSLIAPHRVRAILPLRILLVAVFALTAPAILVALP